MAGKLYEIAFKIAGKISNDFSSSFKAASGAVGGFQSQIQKLNQKAADTDKLIKLKQQVGENARAYLQAKQRAEQMAQALGKNGKPTQEMINNFNKAKAAADRAKNSLERNRAKLRELETQTGNTGVKLKTLIQRQNELKTATDKARRAAEQQAKAQGAFKANKETLANTSMYAGMTGAAVGGGIMASVKTGMDFEAAMSRVGAVSRATDEDLARLSAQAKELGRTTVWSSSQAAEGMQYLAMAGFKVDDMLETMPGMLSLASAGQIELGEAADIASNILTGFGMQAGDMGRVGDVLTNTFTSSNTSLAGLGETMKYAAPIAKSTGASLEEAAAMAAKLGDAGIQGTMAGTTLRSVMLRLSAPSAAGAKELKKLGVATKDAAGNLRPFEDILADLEKAMGSYTQAEKTAAVKTIFETEAMSGAMVLMEQAGSGALQKFTESIKETGAAERVAGKQTDNLKGDMAGLSSATEGLAISVYETLQPTLRELAQGATKVISKVQEWTQANPKLTKVLTLVAAGVGALTAAALPALMIFKTMQFVFAALKAPILGLNVLLKSQTARLILSKGAWLAQKTAMLIWRGAALAVSGAMKLLRGAQIALNWAMRANPIGLVITLLGALVAAGIYVYKNWDTIKQKAIELWTAFKEKFPGLADIAQTAFDNVMSIVEGVKKTFGGIIDFVVGVFTGDWGKAWQGVVDTFGGIFDTIKAVAKAPINGVISMVNAAIGAINGLSVDIPDWVPGMGGKTFGFNIPKIPQLAQGGIATSATVAEIGEGREPEAVLPLSRLDNMLSTSNAPTGDNVSVNFAPVINITGGNTDTYAQVKRGLEEGQKSLKRELEKLYGNQRRLSYY